VSNQSHPPLCQPALAAYAQPRLGRSIGEIFTSAVPYIALSAVMYLTLDVSYLLTLAVAIPTAGFLVRTFVVFHDCAHGSLLSSKRANGYAGRVLGLFVLSPFQRWRHDHAVHHASSGDLERRGVGDIVTLTVAEYDARGWRGRLAYRLIRNPAVMFGLGPVFAMVIGPRIATRSQRPRMRHSVLGTDAVLMVLFAGLCWWLGWSKFLLVWTPPAMLAGAVGCDMPLPEYPKVPIFSVLNSWVGKEGYREAGYGVLLRAAIGRRCCGIAR